MNFRVCSPLVLVKGPDGRTHHVYQGDLIRWPLSDEQRTHLLELKMIEQIGTAQAQSGVLAEQRAQHQADEARSERARQCAAALDEVGVDVHAGAPKARAALRARGHSFANATVADAVRLRRELATPPGMPAMPMTAEMLRP